MLLTPSALAIIVAAFPKSERGAAIGSWTAWAGIATVIGPLVGGYLAGAVSWRLIFAINVPFVAITLVLITLAVPVRAPRSAAPGRVDWLGALLTFLGLAGPVLALTRLPAAGWGSPEVWGPGLCGLALLGVFVAHERRTPAPALPLTLFRRRNFTAGNLQTFAMYGGLGGTFFLLVLFIQEVAGYSALHAGLAMTPVTLVTFALSKRMGRLADRFGPRLFMGLGPLVAAAGLALLLRLGASPGYLSGLLPALLLFSVGLSSTVAPLTATVLADADETDAGVASGVNNAIARIASLLAIAAIGAVVSAQFSLDLGRRLGVLPLSPGARAAVAQARGQTLAGVAPLARWHHGRPSYPGRLRARLPRRNRHLRSPGCCRRSSRPLAAIRNPRRPISCEDCAGGQFAGQPLDAARARPPASGAAAADGGIDQRNRGTSTTRRP